MRGLVATVLSFGLAAAPLAAHAVDAPKAGPSDPRIKVVDYDPWAVVHVTGVFRTATQILLGEDESILHVAVGDATGWDVAAEKNILFATRAGPSSRATRDTVFGLRFRYPDDEKAAVVAAVSAEAAALERKVLELKLERAVVEGRRNLAYSVQGATALQPSEVSDNGRFTVMRFPANQAVPTLFQVEAGGTESLVPFDVRGEFVVVHVVARELRLRRGREVLCIYNEAFDPYGSRPGTGTAASDVERTDKGDPRP
jgi:type IV secretion system protein VirB9